MAKLFKLVKSHGLYVIRDLIILKVGITLILGTAFYLYKYNKNKHKTASRRITATTSIATTNNMNHNREQQWQL